MSRIKHGFLATLPLLFCLSLPTATASEAPLDSRALTGVSQGKALFDINLAEEAKLPLYLQVIEKTYDGLVAQGVSPDFVIAFRGPAVQFIDDSAADAATQQQIAALIARLAAKGVHLEACAIATGLFNVEEKALLPGIELVGNTFISLIGYQAQGYGTIVVM